MSQSEGRGNHDALHSYENARPDAFAYDLAFFAIGILLIIVGATVLRTRKSVVNG